MVPDGVQVMLIAAGAVAGACCAMVGGRVARWLLERRGLGWSDVSRTGGGATGVQGRRRAAAAMTSAALLCALAGASCVWLACASDSAGYPLWAFAGLVCACAISSCDVRERIIPWECCAGLLGAGCLWQLGAGGVGLLASSAAVAVSSWLVVKLGCALYRRRGIEAVGAGDVRAVPACVMYLGTGQFAGVHPLAAGLVLASAATCSCLLVALAFGKLSWRDAVPFGPFFSGWVYSGVMSSPLNAMWA